MLSKQIYILKLSLIALMDRCQTLGQIRDKQSCSYEYITAMCKVKLRSNDAHLCLKVVQAK